MKRVERAAVYLEMAIKEPIDAAEMWSGVGPVKDSEQVAARAIAACVRTSLAFQDRFAGLEPNQRKEMIGEVADIIRRYKTILSERTTSLMSPTTTALRPQEQALQRQFASLRDFLDTPGRKAAFAKVAGKHMSVDRLTRLVLTAASRNPKILECSQQSVLQFTMQCSETGMEPIGAGGAYAIPRFNKKTGCMELAFQPSWGGLLNCAKRAGCIKDAAPYIVHANDKFDYQVGQMPIHKPALRNPGEMIAAYCVLVLPDDSQRVVLMLKEEIEQIRDQYSESWKSGKAGPWGTSPGEMWKKTVVIRAMKPFKGASAELQAALAADDEREAADETLPQIAANPEPDPQPEKKESKPITKAQTKAINELLKHLDLPEDEQDAILGGDVAALTEEQADVVRGKLTKLLESAPRGDLEN